MSDYKKYLLRQMGIKESQVKPSTVNRNAFPGIDPTEPDKVAKKKLVKELFDLSPTAIPTPVVAVAVRGSYTGGLPSGADQTGVFPETPTGKLGGYEPIPTMKDNSNVFNKTPLNPQIASAAVKTENPSTTIDPHPHQTQKSEGEPPQAVTGASTDSDGTLKLKSALPKGVDVDVSEEGNERKEEENDMDGEESMEDQDEVKQDIGESFDEPYKYFICPKCKHRKISGNDSSYCDNCGNPHMKQVNRQHYEKTAPPYKTMSGDIVRQGLNEGGKHKKGCLCGFCKNKGSFGKKKKEDTEECMDEKCMDEKKDKKLDETFKRHTLLMKEYLGIDECATCGCGKTNETHPPGARNPFTTPWRMDPEKAGMVKVAEVDTKEVPKSHDKDIDPASPVPWFTGPPEKPKKSEKDIDPASPVSWFTGPPEKSDKDKVNEKKEGLTRLSEAFERMRGLANLGERRVMSNGLWASSINEANDTNDVKTNDVKTNDGKCPHCKRPLRIAVGSSGERFRCATCGHPIASDAYGKPTIDEKGGAPTPSLRTDMGVAKGKTVPTEKLKSVQSKLQGKSKKATLSDKEAKLLSRINSALKRREKPQ